MMPAGTGGALRLAAQARTAAKPALPHGGLTLYYGTGITLTLWIPTVKFQQGESYEEEDLDGAWSSVRRVHPSGVERLCIWPWASRNQQDNRR
jgi:hypothetical protein